tara:strand:+ start:124 stop:315 length:192 start_codon:yes stop_codon:yes gene_type:complete
MKYEIVKNGRKDSMYFGCILDVNGKMEIKTQVFLSDLDAILAVNWTFYLNAGVFEGFKRDFWM